MNFLDAKGFAFPQFLLLYVKAEILNRGSWTKLIQGPEHGWEENRTFNLTVL